MREILQSEHIQAELHISVKLSFYFPVKTRIRITVSKTEQKQSCERLWEKLQDLKKGWLFCILRSALEKCNNVFWHLLIPGRLLKERATKTSYLQPLAGQTCCCRLRRTLCAKADARHALTKEGIWNPGIENRLHFLADNWQHQTCVSFLLFWKSVEGKKVVHFLLCNKNLF